MIHLVNGRGQLGCELQKLLLDAVSENIYIYHTWNIDDKSKEVQEKEYDKIMSPLKMTKPK